MITEHRWRKARASQNEGNCVEVSHVGAVRDSKNPAGPMLIVPVDALVAAVKADRIG
jgi:Domain of unknown function (DUF397)